MQSDTRPLADADQAVRLRELCRLLIKFHDLGARIHLSEADGVITCTLPLSLLRAYITSLLNGVDLQQDDTAQLLRDLQLRRPQAIASKQRPAAPPLPSLTGHADG